FFIVFLSLLSASLYLLSFPTRRSSDLMLSTYCSSLSQSACSLSCCCPSVSGSVFAKEERNSSLILPRNRSLQRESTSLYSFNCLDRKSTRLNSSHVKISYAVFCL